MDYFCFEKINAILSPQRLYIDSSMFAKQMGLNLIKYRKATVSSQSLMAKAFGVSLAQYRKYEKGVDLPKMHSVARWSIITGAPVYLLLSDTEYAPYLNLSHCYWQHSPFFCTVSHANENTFQSLLSLSKEIMGNREVSEPYPHKVPSLQDVLQDIDSHYYVKVARNMKFIRQHLELTQEQVSELLDISDTTYRQYEKEVNQPRIPFSFFALSHAIFQLDDQWNKTGSSDFARFNHRKHWRLEQLIPLINQADSDQLEKVKTLFNSVAKGLIEEQLQHSLSEYCQT